jgi:hypothetical protein
LLKRYMNRVLEEEGTAFLPAVRDGANGSEFSWDEIRDLHRIAIELGYPYPDSAELVSMETPPEPAKPAGPTVISRSQWSKDFAPSIRRESGEE